MARPRPRRVGRRLPGRRLLIVCEGKDEYLYLRDAARRSFYLSAANVPIECCDGGSPGAIVDRALAVRRRYERSDEAAFDESWVVLDAERVATSGVKEAVRRAHEAGLRVAVSNPSFEIWLLLHAAPRSAPLTAAQAKRLCRDEFCIPIRKGERATFDDPRLGASVSVAIDHAKAGRLDRYDGSDVSTVLSHDLVLERNPSSNLDDLLQSMASARAGRAKS